MPAAIFVIPYADLMFAIIRRARAGKPLMAADRQHLHHRVLNIGHSYRQSVLIMYLWAALFSVTVVSLSVVRTRLVVFEAATLVAVLTLLPVTTPRLRPWRLLARRRPARPGAPPGAALAATRGTALAAPVTAVPAAAPATAAPVHCPGNRRSGNRRSGNRRSGNRRPVHRRPAAPRRPPARCRYRGFLRADRPA